MDRSYAVQIILQDKNSMHYISCCIIQEYDDYFWVDWQDFCKKIRKKEASLLCFPLKECQGTGSHW